MKELTNTQLSCQFCHQPYRKVWLFNDLMYMYIDREADGYYLQFVPKNDSEDTGALYDQADEVKIHACPFCRRNLK